jgi:hypothetical protein
MHEVGAVPRADLVVSIQPTQTEAGDRNITCGHDSFQVTGDGHGCRPIGSQPFSHQPPELGCQLLQPSCPPAHRVLELFPPPIIRSPYGAPFEICLSRYSILHTRYSRIVWPSCPPALVSSHPPLVPVSPCPRVPSAVFTSLKTADVPQSSSRLPPAAPA